MGEQLPAAPDLRIVPLTPDLWNAFETLFGKSGACGGCWCMWWRQTRADFDEKKGDGNRRLMKELVLSGEIPGLLAFQGDTPVGWCSVARRDAFPRLSRSRILKPVDEQPVWSVVCFFVARGYRRKGATLQLLNAAVDYVRANGGTILEGYPVEPAKEKAPDVFLYTGLAGAFLKAGFHEVARRSPTRPVMRYIIPR